METEPVSHGLNRFGTCLRVQSASIGDDLDTPVQTRAHHLFHLGHKRPCVAARPPGACLGQDEHGELGQPVTGEYIDVAPLHHFPGRAQAISIKP